MSLAPVAYLLYQQVMAHDPSDPQWLGRDRFVLSCGHSSLTQYIQLYLSGYGLELDDLKALRTWGSLTPGHPEVAPHRRRRDHDRPARLRPRLGRRDGHGPAPPAGPARPRRHARDQPVRPPRLGASPPTATSWRASPPRRCSLAGPPGAGQPHRHLRRQPDLHRGRHDISFSEDVAARYAAYGWEVIDVDWRRSTDPAGTADYVEDVDALLAALERSRRSRNRPTLIRLHTVIAWPAPHGPGHRQGARRRPRRRRGGRRPRSCSASTRRSPSRSSVRCSPTPARSRPAARRPTGPGRRGMHAWRAADPDRAALLDRLRRRRAARGPRRRDADVPRPNEKGMSTRAASGKVLTRPRRRHARAVGRLGRPRRVEQHDDGGRAVVHPARQADRRSGRAARTAGPCTSASARTRWG